jgi:uncharacterized protein
MSETEQKSIKRLPIMKSRLKLLDEEGTKGVLLGFKCKKCGEYFFGGLSYCQKCTSPDLEPIELSSYGIMKSYTIIAVPVPGWPGQIPYMLGVCQVPEGPRVWSEVIDLPFDTVKIGMPLELTLRVGGKDKEGNELVVYKWRPKSK